MPTLEVLILKETILQLSKGNIKFSVLVQNNPLFYAAWKPVELTLILHDLTVIVKLHKLDEFYNGTLL